MAVAQAQDDFWGISYLPNAGNLGTNVTGEGETPKSPTGGLEDMKTADSPTRATGANSTSGTTNTAAATGSQFESGNWAAGVYRDILGQKEYADLIPGGVYNRLVEDYNKLASDPANAGKNSGDLINMTLSGPQWNMNRVDYLKFISDQENGPNGLPAPGPGTGGTQAPTTTNPGDGEGGHGPFTGGHENGSSGGGGGSTTAGGEGSFPSDIQGLRDLLNSFFSEAVKNGAIAYPGSTTVNTPSQLQDAYNRYSNQQYGADSLFNQLGTAWQEAGGDFKDTIKPGQFKPVYDTLSALMGYKGEDISKGIEAIDVQGKLAIEDQLAAITEKYSALGLGAGSDISNALAQGASRGIADMNVAKENMLIDNLKNAANMRLSSAGQYGGAKASELAMMIQGLTGKYNAQSQLAGQQVAAGGLGLEATKGLERFGLTEYDIQKGNMERSYEQWLNQYKGHPLLPLITQYATASGNAAPAPIPTSNTGAQLAGAGIAGGSSILTALIMAGAFSDREMKEDIKPLAHGEVSAKLSSLPIYRWRYKGDKTQHMGPMAQDFQSAFGVGDGKMIHLVDVMGVLLAAQKEMVNRA